MTRTAFEQARRNFKSRKRRALLKQIGAPSPLLRLLTECRVSYPFDHVEISYEQQSRTFYKAVREGYIEENGKLTQKAHSYLTQKGA